MDKFRELLIRSFDEDLNPAEQAGLKKALAESKELQDEKASLEKMRALISSADIGFDKGFAKRVMDKLDQNRSKEIPEIGLYNIFKRTALAGVAAIFLFLLTIYYVDGSLNMETIYGISEYVPDETENTIFNFEDLE